jgi:hypothetical protein
MAGACGAVGELVARAGDADGVLVGGTVDARDGSCAFALSPGLRIVDGAVLPAHALRPARGGFTFGITRDRYDERDENTP